MTLSASRATKRWADDGGVSRFTTVGIPAEQRIDLWEQYNEAALFRLRAATMSERSLLATQVNVQYGDLRLAHIKANDHVIERTAQFIRARPHDAVCLCLLLEGEAFLYHGRGCETLRAGDAVVYEVDRPFMYGFSTNMRQVIIEVPRRLLDLPGRGSDPYRPHVLRLAGSAAATRAQMAASWVLQAMTQGLASDRRTEIDILNAFHLLVGGGQSGSGAHLSMARTFIESRLAGPLSVEVVAREIGVSSRHLARLFTEAGSTPGRFIMERRMHRAAELLGDPRMNHLSIAQIGEQVGLVQAAHFSRAFKKHFAATPSQWRVLARERRAS
ncbi:MAG: helix-turn-helix domain-containing protein [Intrasporangiaceae bacterium]|nr:helix-turn-helix domain-containing protein [Intrasporangiaceae bacterium]